MNRDDDVSGRPAVLRALRAADTSLTAAQLADRLEVHVNTVRFHLDTLVQQGRVEQVTVRTGGPGRPAHAYRSVRRMDPTGPRRFAELAAVLTEGLAGEPDGPGRAVDLGRAWGRRVADGTDSSAQTRRTAADQLVSLLAEYSFDPDPESTAPIRLHHCPFLELAERHADVVCAVHLGLMQGALRQWGSATAVDRLEPFAEPDLCLVHLNEAAERADD